MQKHFTSDELQEGIRPDKLTHQLKDSQYIPSPRLLSNLVAYAAAMQVLKTKALGTCYLLMN